MERLTPQRSTGIGRNTLRSLGILFLAADVISKAILQNRLLGMGTVSNQQLLESMQNSEDVMVIATAALALNVLGACAVPIFAFLLAEGAVHTTDFKSYLFRVLGVAVISEIPYNLAYSGKLLELSGRNPVFGLVFALIVLYFFRRYNRKRFSDILIRIAVTFAAILWCVILSVEMGAALVLVIVVLWLLWKKPMIRNIAGATVLMVCSVYSLFLMASPMAFLAIHAYNGEKGKDSRMLNYAAYPVLLCLAAASSFII